VDYIRGSDYGGGIGGILYSCRNGEYSYTHYDTRGDVTQKTDSTGNVTYQAQYEAFGTRTREDGSTLDRQKASTKEEDPTGLLNEGFRYRDLQTGSFISKDPAGFIDGPNLYTYVRQNPWSKFDPEGLASYDEVKSMYDKADEYLEAGKNNPHTSVIGTIWWYVAERSQVLNSANQLVEEAYKQKLARDIVEYKYGSSKSEEEKDRIADYLVVAAKIAAELGKQVDLKKIENSIKSMPLKPAPRQVAGKSIDALNAESKKYNQEKTNTPVSPSGKTARDYAIPAPTNSQVEDKSPVKESAPMPISPTVVYPPNLPDPSIPTNQKKLNLDLDIKKIRDIPEKDDKNNEFV
jgi:RHS repeat-associated protein